MKKQYTYFKFNISFLSTTKEILPNLGEKRSTSIYNSISNLGKIHKAGGSIKSNDSEVLKTNLKFRRTYLNKKFLDT